jgi:bile acid:Na+ symporter, BASS family
MDLASLIKLLTLSGLILIMLAIGLKVTFEEVVTAVLKPRLAVLGVVANFVLVPTVIIGLLYVFDANPMVSAGFLILAVCPGGKLGPPLTAIAKGDIPCAIGQMVILAGLSAVISPVLLGLLLAPIIPASELHIDFLAIIRTLLLAQILPLAIGLGINHLAPKLTHRIAKPVDILANLLLLCVVIVVLVKEYEQLGLVRLRGWVGMHLLLAISLSIGWVCGGPGRATRKAFALTAGPRNVPVALVIVATNFAGTPAVTAVVAYALLSSILALVCAFLLARLPGSPASEHLSDLEQPKMLPQPQHR